MGVKNTLGDLNNHLFEQLERLNDDGLTGESLKQEIGRSKAMAIIAAQIVGNANVVLQAQKLYQDELKGLSDMPKMLEG